MSLGKYFNLLMILSIFFSFIQIIFKFPNTCSFKKTLSLILLEKIEGEIYTRKIYQRKLLSGKIILKNQISKRSSQIIANKI